MCSDCPICPLSSMTTSSPHVLHTAVRGDMKKSAMHVACFEHKTCKEGQDLICRISGTLISICYLDITFDIDKPYFKLSSNCLESVTFTIILFSFNGACYLLELLLQFVMFDLNVSVFGFSDHK